MLNLDGMGSYDPDVGPAPSLSFAWEWNGNSLGADEYSMVDWSTLEALGWTSGNTYTVTFTVRDGATTASDTADVIVAPNSPPVATNNSRSLQIDATTSVWGNVIWDDDGAGFDSDPAGEKAEKTGQVRFLVISSRGPRSAVAAID
jgi:hypothetical protein